MLGRSEREDKQGVNIARLLPEGASVGVVKSVVGRGMLDAEGGRLAVVFWVGWNGDFSGPGGCLERA